MIIIHAFRFERLGLFSVQSPLCLRRYCQLPSTVSNDSADLQDNTQGQTRNKTQKFQHRSWAPYDTVEDDLVQTNPRNKQLILIGIHQAVVVPLHSNVQMTSLWTGRRSSLNGRILTMQIAKWSHAFFSVKILKTKMIAESAYDAFLFLGVIQHNNAQLLNLFGKHFPKWKYFLDDIHTVRNTI